ncbi:MBL fold metallo-hydrolase [Chitinophaga sp. Mgbs1]|uniref:MBL fold metallo-hydrolase n=1 Tax=Chitinophaga solisilvae TaxID=1233460 RepID=A0A433WPK2_9BACT|nr:MBL fold metallo-hydrolase [Chitinophaga solisilvae]
MLHIHSFRFDHFNENAYLVFNEEKECLIIDPGCYSQEETTGITSFISFYHLAPAAMFITHAHIDHILGVAPLLQHYNIPLCIHRKEMQVLERMPEIGQAKGFNIMPLPNTSVQFLQEGDELHVGRESFRLLETPGHTQHSLSLIHDEQQVIFSGDVLFRNRIGKTTLPGGDYNTLVTTIREKLFTLPDDTMVYPGHGVRTSVGYEKNSNEFICWE